MTIQSPQKEEQPPRSRSRSRRAPDYRLRGLDLEAHELVESAPHPVRKRQPRRRRRLLIRWAILLMVAATATLLLREYVVEPFSVRSASMVPTLPAGTDVLVVKSSLLTEPIKAGDIIVLHEPNGSRCSSGGDSHDLVKRVIGEPGETIWSAGGSIYVNGRRLDEPGWYNPPSGELGGRRIPRTTIPAGNYFVMGDNRIGPCDSRSFGPIPKSLVVGRVVATIARDGHPFVHGI